MLDDINVELNFLISIVKGSSEKFNPESKQSLIQSYRDLKIDDTKIDTIAEFCNCITLSFDQTVSLFGEGIVEERMLKDFFNHVICIEDIGHLYENILEFSKTNDRNFIILMNNILSTVLKEMEYIQNCKKDIY